MKRVCFWGCVENVTRFAPSLSLGLCSHGHGGPLPQAYHLIAFYRSCPIRCLTLVLFQSCLWALLPLLIGDVNVCFTAHKPIRYIRHKKNKTVDFFFSPNSLLSVLTGNKWRSKCSFSVSWCWAAKQNSFITKRQSVWTKRTRSQLLGLKDKQRSLSCKVNQIWTETSSSTWTLNISIRTEGQIMLAGTELTSLGILQFILLSLDISKYILCF